MSKKAVQPKAKAKAKAEAEFTYRVLTSDGSRQLEIVVQEYRLLGYKLQGGVSLAVHPDGRFLYTQAIVKFAPTTLKGKKPV